MVYHTMNENTLGTAFFNRAVHPRITSTDTWGESIFQAVQSFFQHQNLPLWNIITCSTDGAPPMIGCYRGCTALLKKAVPSVFSFIV